MDKYIEFYIISKKLISYILKDFEKFLTLTKLTSIKHKDVYILFLRVLLLAPQGYFSWQNPIDIIRGHPNQEANNLIANKLDTSTDSDVELRSAYDYSRPRHSSSFARELRTQFELESMRA